MSSPVAPSRWGSGVQWGTEQYPSAAAYWSSGVAPTSGTPHVFVALDGTLVNSFEDPTKGLQSGTWRLGRNDWFDVLSPNQASLAFAGQVDTNTGDSVVITTETGMLWIGTVDAVTTTTDAAGNVTTSITATDIIGQLSQTVVPLLEAVSYSDGSVHTVRHRYYSFTIDGFTSLTALKIAKYWLSLYGYNDATSSSVRITAGDSATALPTLDTFWYDPPGAQTLLTLLNKAEQSSNAMMALQPDGSIIIVTRDAITAGSVSVVDLSGPDAPSSWSETIDRTNLLNHWTLQQSSYLTSTPTLDQQMTAVTDPLTGLTVNSVAVYGDRSYSVSDYLCSTAAHFGSGMKAAMALPRTVVPSGTIPIKDNGQSAILLAPLAWVSQNGDTWQVMSVAHSFGGSSWTVTIAADVSQNAMAGVTDPTPTDPVTTHTDTYTSVKAATVASSGGGNGGGSRIAVGRYGGIVARGYIDFPTITKPAGYIDVKKATLTLHTGNEDWVAFGSNPKVTIRVVKKAWTAGSFAGSPPSQYSSTNSLTWSNQPDVVAGATITKTVTSAHGTDVDFDVTDHVQQMLDGGYQYGFRVIVPNESSTANTTEFCSDDSGNPPTLKVICHTS